MRLFERTVNATDGLKYNKINHNENVSTNIYAVDTAHNPYLYKGIDTGPNSREFINFHVNAYAVNANRTFYRTNFESERIHGRRK